MSGPTTDALREAARAVVDWYEEWCEVGGTAALDGLDAAIGQARTALGDKPPTGDAPTDAQCQRCGKDGGVDDHYGLCCACIVPFDLECNAAGTPQEYAKGYDHGWRDGRKGYVPESLSPEWHAELAYVAAEAADAALARVEEAVRALAACHPECVLWGRTRHLHRLDAEPVLAAIRSVKEVAAADRELEDGGGVLYEVRDGDLRAADAAIRWGAAMADPAFVAGMEQGRADFAAGRITPFAAIRSERTGDQEP